MKKVNYNSKDMTELMKSFESGNIIPDETAKQLEKKSISAVTSKFSQKRSEIERRNNIKASE